MASIIRLYQLENGYFYNSDSLFLVDFISKFVKKNMNILDVGAGCGIVGLLCKKYFEVESSLVELDSSVYKIACINAKTNNLEVNVINENFLNLKLESKFDFIVSNPPFYRVGALKSKNPIIAMAKSAESLPLSLWIKHSKKFLKPRGGLIFCYRCDDLSLIVKELSLNGFNIEHMRFVYPLINKSASLVLIKARLESKTPLNILPPLITHNSSLQTDFSDEVKQIYETYKTYSIKAGL